MKTIALFAALAMALQNLIGTRSSVGGPMTLMLIAFLAMLAAGVYDAWSRKRGVLGWILSIVAAVIGGFVAALLFGMAMDVIIPLLNMIPFVKLEGSLVSSQHPVLYILTAAMAALTVFGSWIALQLVSRLLDRNERVRANA